MYVICPECSGALEGSGDTLSCGSCGRELPVVNGVIDERPAGIPLDDALVNHLLDMFENTGSAFELSNEIMAFKRRTEKVDAPEHIQRMWEELRRNAETVGSGAYDVACRAVQIAGKDFAKGTVLDLGSGSGALIPVLAKNFRHVFAVEPEMPNQIVASKRVEEKGLSNVTLIAGVGEEPHLASGSIDFVIMNNVIEHVRDVDAVMRNVRSCLRKDGVLCLDSANRYNLFLGEPHTGLHGMGFIPRRMMEPYVRMRRGMNYDVHLLSYFDLKKIMRRYFGKDFTVFPTPLPLGGEKGLIKNAFERLCGMPVTGEVSALILPSLYAVAVKRG